MSSKNKTANDSSFSFPTYSCMHEQRTHHEIMCTESAAKLFLLPYHSKMVELEPSWEAFYTGVYLIKQQIINLFPKQPLDSILY